MRCLKLGMRLAFDKATIIIKDDFTDYSFDTSVIEHLSYPRDLRFTKILEFKEKLKNKITATYGKSKADPNYSTFLKSFGEYKVSRLEHTEVSSEAYILESLNELKKEVHSLRRINSGPVRSGIMERSDSVIQNCINRTILEFLRLNNIRSRIELVDRINELVDFVKSDHHIQLAHGPE